MSKISSTLEEFLLEMLQVSFASRIFFASCNFQDTFVEFCFMMFTQVLMKELARILIHVRKTFNCRASFKILFSMCLAIAEKEL